MSFISIENGKRFINLAHVTSAKVVADDRVLLSMKDGDPVTVTGADAKEVVEVLRTGRLQPERV